MNKLNFRKSFTAIALLLALVLFVGLLVTGCKQNKSDGYTPPPI